ncbi:MAG: carboxylating nicotinate-nucleotide diphosphorylase [Alphaproteobacteria bacterium]|nr:carboxylating nicotinate-nucleotide diphosphorylase [Alphaproteobacteria bacterium]
MPMPPLPDLLIRPIIKTALHEDLGRSGDLTSATLLDPKSQFQGQIVARQAGLLCGIDFARITFATLDEKIAFTPLIRDGSLLQKGDVIANLHGAAQSILMGERVALNFLTHLSGIASMTSEMVAAIAGNQAKLTDTRKTLPGLRMAQKYAVRVGGGVNHRFGLDDAILIKDNHIAAVGSVTESLQRARQRLGHMVKIELEVDSIAQIKEMLAGPPQFWPDCLLLDNMSPSVLRDAVHLVRQGEQAMRNSRHFVHFSKITLEASGGVTLKTIGAIAASGVDVISCGKLTMSANALDIALDANVNKT